MNLGKTGMSYSPKLSAVIGVRRRYRFNRCIGAASIVSVAFISLIGLAACQPVVDQEPAVSMQQLRAGRSEQGEVFLGMDFLVTDDTGAAVPCGMGSIELDVSVSSDGEDGEYVQLPSSSVTPICVGPGYGDFALVADNSGSENGFIDELKEAAREMVDRLVSAGGRASLTRVSTNAKIVQELTDSQAALNEAIDSLFIKNGWTALYDGIRMGNETLGQAKIDDAEGDTYANGDVFCSASRKLGIVVFTDGQENNSSLQKLDSPKMTEDGIDTELDDLYNLRVDGITTPVYTVGLGRKVNASMLRELAEYTGGRFMHIDEPAKIDDVFGLISEYAESTNQVCVDLPVSKCGNLHVKIDYTWENEGQILQGSKQHTIHVDCPPVEVGRTATVLLTMSDPGIPEETAATLSEQAVRWVSQSLSPKVLVVRDDNHHDELKDDPLYVQALLNHAGLQADFVVEPKHGVTMDVLDGYDVVWFSNPGYSMDDKASVEVLREFSANGGGLVMQGDDMAWAFGKSFDMSDLLHLDFIDNGTRACGVKVSDNKSGRYLVEFSEEGHPVSEGLDGTSFEYGDDIDETVQLHDGEEVVAWATSVLEKDGTESCKIKRPVVVAYQP